MPSGSDVPEVKDDQTGQWITDEFGEHVEVAGNQDYVNDFVQYEMENYNQYLFDHYGSDASKQYCLTCYWNCEQCAPGLIPREETVTEYDWTTGDYVESTKLTCNEGCAMGDVLKLTSRVNGTVVEISSQNYYTQYEKMRQIMDDEDIV